LVPKQEDPDEGELKIIILFVSLFCFKLNFVETIKRLFCFCWKMIQAQHERADNSSLRAENDRIRCENIAIREALKNVICPSCGAPSVTEDSYFDEQKLRIENAQLKEEV